MVQKQSQMCLVYFLTCWLLVIACVSPANPARRQLDSPAKARANVQVAVEVLDRNEIRRCIALLREAKELDPELPEARLYLALVLAYADPGDRLREAARELEELLAKKPAHVVARLHLGILWRLLYTPGDTSEENLRAGNQAVATFGRVLEHEPKNLLALDAIGALLFLMGASPYDPKKLEESKTYHLKHIQLKPDDPEPYCWVGEINWTLAFRGNRQIREDYNAKARKPLEDKEPLPPNVRQDFVAKYGPVVDQGIHMLKKAIKRRPDNHDAMAYLSLLYRLKADQVDSPDDRKQYIRMADGLVHKAKQAKMETQQSPPRREPLKGKKPRLVALVDFEFPELLDALLGPPPVPPPPPRTAP